MARQSAVIVGDLSALIPSWLRHLRAANLSPRTIPNYELAARQLLEFLDQSGMPTEAGSIHREHVEAFIEHILAIRTASTAATRYRGLQQLFRWLEEEGEVPGSPMTRMRPPKLDEKEIPVVSSDDLRALLKACTGREFEERRDSALLYMFIDTGARLAEITNLQRGDIDLDLGVALVLGKGRRERALPMSPSTIKAVDRYPPCAGPPPPCRPPIALDWPQRSVDKLWG